MKLVDLDRCYSVQRLSVGERELVLYNLHLSAYTSDGTIAEKQLKMLFADMLAEYEKGNYAIAGGDFNKDILGHSEETFGVSGPDYTWAQPIPPELVPEGLSIVAPVDEAPAATWSPWTASSSPLMSPWSTLRSATPPSAGATTTPFTWILSWNEKIPLAQPGEGD